MCPFHGNTSLSERVHSDMLPPKAAQDERKYIFLIVFSILLKEGKNSIHIHLANSCHNAMWQANARIGVCSICPRSFDPQRNALTLQAPAARYPPPPNFLALYQADFSCGLHPQCKCMFGRKNYAITAPLWKNNLTNYLPFLVGISRRGRLEPRCISL